MYRFIDLCMCIQWNLRIKDTLGQGVFFLYREVSFIQRLKYTVIGMSRFVLYREVSLFGVSFIGGSTVRLTWLKNGRDVAGRRRRGWQTGNKQSINGGLMVSAA